MRNTIDMTALGRSAIGFERMFDLIRANEGEGTDTYPPYNIENSARIITESRLRLRDSPKVTSPSRRSPTF